MTCKSIWIGVKSSLGDWKEPQWPLDPVWCVRKFRLSCHKDRHVFKAYLGLFVELCRVKLVLVGTIKIRFVKTFPYVLCKNQTYQYLILTWVRFLLTWSKLVSVVRDKLALLRGEKDRRSVYNSIKKDNILHIHLRHLSTRKTITSTTPCFSWRVRIMLREELEFWQVFQ